MRRRRMKLPRAASASSDARDPRAARGPVSQPQPLPSSVVATVAVSHALLAVLQTNPAAQSSLDPQLSRHVPPLHLVTPHDVILPSASTIEKPSFEQVAAVGAHLPDWQANFGAQSVSLAQLVLQRVLPSQANPLQPTAAPSWHAPALSHLASVCCPLAHFALHSLPAR